MSTEWKFPEIYDGDGILVSRDPSRSDVVYGTVTKVKETVQAIDAWVMFPGGPVIFEHLWHKDDPRIAKEADRFTNSCSGVFELSTSVRSRIGLLARLDELEKRFANLEQYVTGDVMPPAPVLEVDPNQAELQKSVETLANALEKRPRGRPRRIPITVEAAL